MLTVTFRDCLNHGLNRLKDFADYGNSIALTKGTLSPSLSRSLSHSLIGRLISVDCSLDRSAHPKRSHFKIALDEIVQVRPERTVSYT